jgi:hypothetical protein
MADKRISQLVERTDIANNDVVPIVASGATTTNKATISSIQEFMQENLDLGVTSVGITLGTTGTDVSVTGSPITTSGNITINLPTASATNRGLLSSADWTTFNNKQAAGNYVTLDTAQTITAQKTFTTSGSSDTMIISHGSGSGFALDVIKAGNGEAIRVTKTSGSGNAMSVIGGVLSTEGISVNTPSNGISVLLNGRTSDNFSSIRFGANTGAGQYNSIGANSSSFDISSLGNTPITFSTNTQGSGGIRMTIAGSGGVTFTNGITTTSAVLTSVLQGVNANFSGLIETSDSVRIGTTASVKHSNTGFTLSGYNNIHGNIDGFVVQNQTKGFRINFPSNAGFTHTLPDASGTIALTSNLGAYLPLTGGTLTGALNGTSATFTAAAIPVVFKSTNATTMITEYYYNTSTLSGSIGSGSGILSGANASDFIVRSEADFVVATGGNNKRLTINSAGAATFSSSVNVSGILQVKSTSTSPSIWAGGYGGGITILADNATSNRYLDLSIVDSAGAIAAQGIRVNTLGNVGIGTDSPVTALTIGSRPNTTTFGTPAYGSTVIRSLTLTPTADQRGTLNLECTSRHALDRGALLTFSQNYSTGVDGYEFVGAAIKAGAESASNTSQKTYLSFFTNTSDSSSLTEKMRITSDGYARLSASSGGIQFNGDTAAANALDDYEEGTWTMGISFGGSSTGVTYGANTGTYTKVGRKVTVSGYLLLTNKGSSTGAAKITGLPFTTLNSQSGLSTCSFWLNNVTFLNQHQGVLEVNTTRIELWEITSTGVVSFLDDLNFANNSEVIVSLTYFV